MKTYHLPPGRLPSLLGAFEGRRVLVLGDLMLDEYVWGHVSRISPEAPVMVVEVREKTYCLGGAGNVATNVQAMGGVPVLSGVIGEDLMGQVLREHVVKCGSVEDGVFPAGRRTTTVKTRIVAHSQQVVRVDHETREPLSGDDEERLLLFLHAALPSCDAVILSDYAKGTLTDRIVAESIRAAREAGKPVAANLKPPRVAPFAGATLLSLNHAEAERAAGESIPDEPALVRAGTELRDRMECEALLITRGPDGVALFTAGHSVHIPARRVEVYDVAGAGDAVISAATMALAAGASPSEAAAVGNLAGNVKVTKLGVAPVSRDEMRAMAERDAH